MQHSPAYWIVLHLDFEPKQIPCGNDSKKGKSNGNGNGSGNGSGNSNGNGKSNGSSSGNSYGKCGGLFACYGRSERLP
jgi:hypothetical protein